MKHQRTAASKEQARGRAEDESVVGPDRDTTFHLLQNERRRLALRYLLDRRADGETVVEMRALAEQVAAWEHDTTLAALDSDERQRVYIGLYQSHLPTLDQHGIIDYEQARGRVKLRDGVDALEPYLEQTPVTGDTPEGTGAPPPASESQAHSDGSDSGGLSHLLLGVFGIVPLAAIASSVGPSIGVSIALLVVMLGATAILGGGAQRYVSAVRDS